MPIYPNAHYMPIRANYGGPRQRTRAVVLHVDAGGAQSLYGWFNNPAAMASSHFYVTYAGRVEQYLDIGTTAWTQRAGNASCIGIETQGVGDGAWTEAQLNALAPLLRWLCQFYSIPVKDMGSSAPTASGIGMHRYGIDPWRRPDGEVWGANGKVCPGEKRVAQFAGLLQRARALPPPRREWDTDDMPMIYHARGERTPFGIYSHSGGWAELFTQAEYDSLKNAGVPEVWVERQTLDWLIKDSRSH